jgi:NTP pyrophosphatase (non-canonical NTP hydrolase)
MINTFQEYQEATAKTAIYPKHRAIEYCVVGLAGESGELAGKYSKVIRDDKEQISEERRQAMLYEMGDVFWFLSELSTSLGYTLQEVANTNINKLQDRYNRGKLSGEGDLR